MIIIHHLNNSRSQRILWLLEELGADYEIRFYQRNEINRAPPELKEAHPLGKSPIIEDGNFKIAESGAAVDYLIRTYGGGKFMPAMGTDSYERYNEWMHYAEGSAMVPLLMKLFTSLLGEGGVCLTEAVIYELPQGYCSKTCTLPAGTQYSVDDAQCDPAGGVDCIGQAPLFQVCAPQCTDDAQCTRDGYTCRNFPLIAMEGDPTYCLMPDCCEGSCAEE